MRDTIDMAIEALVVPFFLKKENNELIARLKDFEALVRADQREIDAKLLESRMTGANELMDAVRDMEARAIRARGNT